MKQIHENKVESIANTLNLKIKTSAQTKIDSISRVGDEILTSMGGWFFSSKIPRSKPFQKHLQDSAVQPADANIPGKWFFVDLWRWRSCINKNYRLKVGPYQKITFISDVLWNHFVVENSKFRMLKSDVGRLTYNWSSTKNLGPKTPHQPPTVSISPGGEEIYQQGLHVPRSFQSKGHHPRSAKENTCFCLKNQN